MKTITFFLFAILVLMAGLIGISLRGSPGKPKFFVVESGSMVPSIRPGSIILSLAQKTYSKGDIITFNNSHIITHRIIATATVQNETVFVTKGEANQKSDLALVHKSQILGKSILVIPFLGFLTSFIKTLPGLVLFLVIPASLLVLNEIFSLRREIKKMLQISTA